jgi:hypothetical protein
MIRISIGPVACAAIAGRARSYHPGGRAGETDVGFA